MQGFALFFRAILIFLPLSLCAVAAWWVVHQSSRIIEETRFEMRISSALEEIKTTLSIEEQVLRSVLALFEASGRVSRAQFNQYIHSRKLPEFFPSIRAVGLAYKVTDAYRSEHIEKARRSIPDYAIRPAGKRESYYPVLFVAPTNADNMGGLGLDLYAEPVRRAAMDLAIETNTPQLTGQVLIKAWTPAGAERGTIMFLPFYGPMAAAPTTVEERLKRLIGLVFIPFNLEDILAKPLVAGGLCAEVTDLGQSEKNDGLLFQSINCVPGKFSQTKLVELYGRKWTINFQSTPQLDKDLMVEYDILILPIGLMGAGFLTWLILSYTAARQRNLVLDAARLQAEAAHQSGVRFLAAISHDLRQPLQSLGFYVELLAAGQRDSKAATGAFTTLQGAQRLLDTLTDMASMESGAITPSISRFDVSILLKCLCDEVRGDLELKQLTLRQRLPSIWIDTDEVMLGRVVRNLLNNAIKYTSRGAIFVSCREHNGMLTIKVADSGPGIPQDKQELIFKDYVRLDGASEAAQGLGIGLATVSRITRLLGYKLRVLSKPGMGSSFLVDVPMDKSAVPETKP